MADILFHIALHLAKDVFWRLRHYLHISVCQHGLYTEINLCCYIVCQNRFCQPLFSFSLWQIARVCNPYLANLIGATAKSCIDELTFCLNSAKCGFCPLGPIVKVANCQQYKYVRRGGADDPAITHSASGLVLYCWLLAKNIAFLQRG